MEDEPNTTKLDRGLAVLGWLWIPVIWLLAVTSDLPAVWKWALTFYGAYGLFECTATLSEKRNAWAPNLKVARMGSIGFLLGAAALVAFESA